MDIGLIILPNLIIRPRKEKEMKATANA